MYHLFPRLTILVIDKYKYVQRLLRLADHHRAWPRGLARFIRAVGGGSPPLAALHWGLIGLYAFLHIERWCGIAMRQCLLT